MVCNFVFMSWAHHKLFNLWSEKRPMSTSEPISLYVITDPPNHPDMKGGVDVARQTVKFSVKENPIW